MRWMMLACLTLACGCKGTSGPGAGADAGTLPIVGSGTVEGEGGFDVVAVRFRDPGPFSGKERVEIALSNDSACGRVPSCSPYTELVLKLSAEGEIAAGPYQQINPPEGTGSLSVELVTVTAGDGRCSVGGQPAVRGSVTLESVTATELKGSFDVQILAVDGTEPVVTGQFTALQCP